MDEERKKTGIFFAEMLAVKKGHGPVKNPDIIDAALLCALSFVMDDSGVREIIIFISRPDNAVREVDVFAIHEKGLIKEPDFVQNAFAQHHEGTRQHFHLVYFLIAQISQVVAGKDPGRRKEGRQAEGLIERHGRRRECTLRFFEKFALAVQHFDSQPPGFGVFVHECDTFFEGVFLHHRIGIEQKNIFRLRFFDGLVVGFRKAEVFLVCDKPHLRKSLTQHLGRSVSRCIVHYPYFHIEILRSPQYRLQCLLEEVLHIITDNDDRKLCHYLLTR